MNVDDMNEKECDSLLTALLKKDVRFRNSKENLMILKLQIRKEKLNDSV